MQEKSRTFLHDAINFAGLAAQALESDDFSDCFRATSPYEMNKSGILYIFSFLVRYFILFPLKVLVLILGIVLIGFYFLVGNYFNYYEIVQHSFLLFNKLMIFSFNFRVKHFGSKVRISEPHVYVSNHTSFIDYIVLSSHKFSHACISEWHGGLFGFILMNILSKNGSVGFKRSDKQDRSQVLTKIKEHIHKNRAPMLIFPEGTCVNNKYTVLFQKGAFELDALVCPVAIKYKKDLLDPYWNRRLHGFTKHILYLLTRWRIDVEVHWLDPISKDNNESPAEFSHRVKGLISNKIGIKNTLWNGSFKSTPVLKDREILKSSFKLVYNQLRNENNEMTDENNKNEKIYFGKINYKTFLHKCCKEYLKMKDQKLENIN